MKMVMETHAKHRVYIKSEFYVTQGFSTIQSKIDRWHNLWQNSAAENVSYSASTLKTFNPQNPPKEFFNHLDAAFTLFEPRRQNPHKEISFEAGTVDNTISQITRAYWQARDADEHQIALRTGIAFSNFSWLFRYLR